MSLTAGPATPSRYLDRPRLLALAGVTMGSAAAWTGLELIHPSGTASSAEWFAALCRGVALPISTALPAAVAIWVLMSIAMMLPTAAPAIDIYVRLSRRIEAHRAGHVAAFAGGYLAAWAGFAAIAGLAQVTLGNQIGEVMQSLPRNILAGTLLIIAGGYQLTPLKQACLTQCRNPLAFFMANWREGIAGAGRMGAHHGAICIGCCWALMGLMFLFGTMNLAWMAALGLAMLLEKAAPGAAFVGRLLGLAMAMAGTALIATTII